MVSVAIILHFDKKIYVFGLLTSKKTLGSAWYCTKNYYQPWAKCVKTFENCFLAFPGIAPHAKFCTICTISRISKNQFRAVSHNFAQYESPPLSSCCFGNRLRRFPCLPQKGQFLVLPFATMIDWSKKKGTPVWLASPGFHKAVICDPICVE